MKRNLLIIAVLMGLCLLVWPFSAGAIDSGGECGVYMFWNLSGGTLAFTGDGRMGDFTDPRESYSYPPPWYDYRNGIKAATFQTGITSVGEYAFFQCTKLESVSLPDSVDLIGAHAFEKCTGLSSIDIPAKVGSIREYAFAECTALTSFTIPDGVTTIDVCTFYKCTGLKSITIPASVTAIEDNAFTDCGLTYVDFGGTQDQWAGIRKNLGKNAPLATAVIHCSDTPLSCEHTTRETVREHEVAATCTAEGSYEEVVYCVDCGNELSRETVVTGRLGHDPVHHEEKAATCTEAGQEECWECTVCGALFKDKNCEQCLDEIGIVPATGHTEVKDAGREPTCKEPGLTEGSHCSVCNAVIVEQKAINALGHDLERHEAKEPTCTEIGWNLHFTCTRCDYTTYAELPALGHQLERHMAKAPTCTEAGQEEHWECTACGALFKNQDCAVCGEELSIIDVIIPAAHDFGEPVFEWSEDGRMCTAVQTCSRNAEHKKSSSCEIAATVTKSPTEEEAGSIMRVPLFENRLCESGAITEEIPALKDMDVLKLPAGLETIEEGAFSGILCEAVIIPDGCREIKAGAFEDCGNLRYVRIPDAVIVSDTAFPDRDDLILDRSRQDP